MNHVFETGMDIIDAVDKLFFALFFFRFLLIRVILHMICILSCFFVFYTTQYSSVRIRQ